MNELELLIEIVVAHVRNREVKAAVQAINAARSAEAQRSLDGRQAVLQVASDALRTAKQQRLRVLAAVEALPAAERFEAEHVLIPTLDAVFGDPIAGLRQERRKLRRP